MRNTQALKEFISKWRASSLPSKDILYDYKPFCRDLLFEDEDVVRDTIDLLKNNIELWAKKFSPAYSEYREFISKTELSKSDLWHVKFSIEESASMATSGSTTGKPFRYLRWEPFLYFIEGINHYDLVLDEFDIPSKPKILYLFNNNQYDQSRLITIKDDSTNFMEHHGTIRKAEIHYVNFMLLQSDHKEFFPRLLNYLLKIKPDVIFSPGPTTNSMCHYMRKMGISEIICKLLSNTNERLLQQDAIYLLDGHVNHICDHMRCWDGGATFFTCKHRNYHLLDNLSWCEEKEEKLISTDYFSIPSPFVRYWNGDLCHIGQSYQRCECGRLYREFDFLQNRPFSLKGMCLEELRRKIEKIASKCTKQIRCGLNTIDIISSSEMPDEQKGEISRISDKFEFRFIVED